LAHEFVYTMQDLGKVVPPDRVILEDITLAFFPGAKIGVLGLNGAGKSSLLRIMAGLDADFVGEARPTPGVRVGHLSQEPDLDASVDVLGNVEQGVRPQRELLRRFEEVSARFAEPLDDDQMNALLEEQAKLQDQIDAANLWELDRTLEVAMEALRVPPGDTDVSTLSGGIRRVARALSPGVSRHGRRHHPRPLLPRQRRRLDPRARPRARHPLEGQLLLLAGAEGAATRPRGEAGVGAPAHAAARAGVDPHDAARAPRQG
jgi:energy-coupling factor transporter ATP-binding protein EcfA2